MRDLGGSVAVVTGAASGIGAALADELTAEGVSVVLADIDEDRLDSVASRQARGGANVLAVPTNVADEESVAALAAAAVRHFGRVDLLFNNAGVAGPFEAAWATPAPAWKRVVDVNLWGVVHGVRIFVPLFLEQGAGHVINTASAAMFEALPGMAAYAATKHAVLGFSEALYRELSDTAVGVSVLVPGELARTNILVSPATGAQDGDAAASAARPAVVTAMREAFSTAMDNAVDPHLIARAALEGVRERRFLICDDAQALASWGEHHAVLARGASPEFAGQSRG